jgi:hypothetical protein
LVRRLCAVRCFTRFRPSLPPFTLVTTFTAREWRNLADAPDLGVGAPRPTKRTPSALMVLRLAAGESPESRASSHHAMVTRALLHYSGLAPS